MLLRSYDSRKEPPPDFDCTIWQAGRASCAMLHHFKPVHIGQHIFLDEGAGKFNPSPLILDEATVNEWPGREVGVFVSIGTGKRPPGTSNLKHEWWEDVFADFADARRNLISKIEGCEVTHQYMLKEHLARRNVPKENYCRFNVEVGVGEYGMNEWTRLTEISTNTRIYLAKNEVQKMTYDSSVRLAKINRMHRRIEAREAAAAAGGNRESNLMTRPLPPPPPPPNRPIPPIPGASPQPSPKHPPSLTANPQQFNAPPSIHPIYELPAIELPADSMPIQSKPPSWNSNTGNTPPPTRHSLDQSSRPVSSSGISPRISVDAASFESGIGGISGPPIPPKTPIPHAARPVNTVHSGSNHNDNITSAGSVPNSHGLAVENNNTDGGVIISMPSPTQGASRPIATINPASNTWRPPYPDDGPPPPVKKYRKPTTTSHARG